MSETQPLVRHNFLGLIRPWVPVRPSTDATLVRFLRRPAATGRAAMEMVKAIWYSCDGRARRARAAGGGRRVRHYPILLYCSLPSLWTSTVLLALCEERAAKERLFKEGMITDTVARTVECRKGSDCSLGRHLPHLSFFRRVLKATVWRRSEQRTQNQNGIRSVRPSASVSPPAQTSTPSGLE